MRVLQTFAAKLQATTTAALTRATGVALATLLATQAHAGAQLSQPELLARCYAQLTGQRLKANDAHYKELTTKTAAQVCTDILAKTQLNPTSGELATDTAESRAVLKQFHDLHRSWFDTQVFSQNQFGDGLYGTVDVYDLSSASMHVTRALFLNQPYKTALSGSDYLYAIRDQGSNKLLRPSRAFGFTTGDGTGNPRTNFDDHIVYSPRDAGVNFLDDNRGGIAANEVTPTDLIQIGVLKGIGIKTDTPNINHVYVDPNVGANPPGIISPSNLHANYGGGALGEPSYLLSTFGHGFDYHSNGTTKLPRRYISSAFKIFLCRPDSYVRDEDVTGLIRTNSDAAAFRGANSCLKCHAAMDQAATLARNLTPAASGFLSNTVIRMTATVARYSSTGSNAAGQEDWPSSPVANFAQQKPAGKFYFRSYTGDLLDQKLTSVDDNHPLEALGTAMAASNDYYACVASRYVEYFMGVKVPLVDPGNSANVANVQAMTAKDKQWKAFVVDLGAKLKADGSLKNLVKNIITSAPYSQADFGK